ncbi:xylulokinase [Bacillus marinisedimentorum]|uniref:xylulokinase n=1 Tax=Bacillus marinisedimentorum TaxID=1821260 RepID=UPI0007E206B7|nr:xylulokinase [Bacillus marinisedimentorum]
MKYVIGVDLGTSAVKAMLVNQQGEVVQEEARSYPLIQEKSGYSEQDPEEWVKKTKEALSKLIDNFNGNPESIEGLSFSGQMHGLVLLDNEGNVLRNAILWNDTRTTEQCDEIYKKVGERRLLDITKNPALEGFTLPKLLWVNQHEPEIMAEAEVFLLPKDYLRYRMTGKINSEYSDAAGTLLLNVGKKEWSGEICEAVGINPDMCPPLVDSHANIGSLSPEFAEETGLPSSLTIFAGGADNACGAIGSGVLSEGETMCSTGTSGVVLSYESRSDQDFGGKVHYFNHGDADAFYTMGVTLAAGYSLSWFKDKFAPEESYDELLEAAGKVPPGANGLLFTPYIAGERTPHADAAIRGSFIGMDASHEKKHFTRAVLEGITFSLAESLEIFRNNGKIIETIVSIGGGAKSETWLQLQADMFDADIVKLKSEQGPGMGAAMLAAYGAGWFDSLKECADEFIHVQKIYSPDKKKVVVYKKLFKIYQEVYTQTKPLNDALKPFRN